MEDARRIRNSVITYVVLTFAISSISYYQLYQRGKGFFIFTLMWSPGVAGLLTRFLFQKNLRGHGWGWGKTKYQFASYWIPLVYASVVYLPLWFAGYADFHSATFGNLATHLARGGLPSWAAVPAYILIAATLGVIGSCTSALGEELGWRGFLVPELAKIIAFPNVALISGVIWALWHYPIIFMGLYKGRNPLWYSVVCFTVLVIGDSFLFAWMRLKSGSVWTGMFLHASHNLFIQGVFDRFTRRAPLTDYVTTEFGAGLAIVAVAIAVIFYRKRSELPQRLAS